MPVTLNPLQNVTFSEKTIQPVTTYAEEARQLIQFKIG